MRTQRVLNLRDMKALLEPQQSKPLSEADRKQLMDDYKAADAFAQKVLEKRKPSMKLRTRKP